MKDEKNWLFTILATTTALSFFITTGFMVAVNDINTNRPCINDVVHNVSDNIEYKSDGLLPACCHSSYRASGFYPDRTDSC